MARDTVRRVLEETRDRTVIDLARLERMSARVDFPSLRALVQQTARDLDNLNHALKHGWSP
jgi:hypothetical protein